MALNRVAMPSPNYSSRGGSTVRLVVLHTAEGATTIESLGNFFASSSSGVSSHAGIDDQAGKIGVYVKRADKAWTAAAANPYSVQAELCGFAEWSTDTWRKGHPNMLANAAAWIAEECAAFGVPLRKLSAYEAQSGAAGVCQHVDLGADGGGHWDCGPGFPIDYVLQLAAGAAPEPEPEPPALEDFVSLTSLIDRDGNIRIYGLDPDGDLIEITDANPQAGDSYRFSNITANNHGTKLAT
jgi:hypothetical protein